MYQRTTLQENTVSAMVNTPDAYMYCENMHVKYKSWNRLYAIKDKTHGYNTIGINQLTDQQLTVHRHPIASIG